MVTLLPPYTTLRGCREVAPLSALKAEEEAHKLINALCFTYCNNTGILAGREKVSLVHCMPPDCVCMFSDRRPH